MNPKPDYLRKRYGPMREKSLKNAISYRIARDFPRVGGERIRQFCAEAILEVVQQHLRPREHVRHGQVVWLAVSLNDPPGRQKRIRDTELVPVILDLSTADDIQAILDRVKPQERLRRKALRLCEQAHAQGALLSNVDLAELLNHGDAQIRYLADFDRVRQCRQLGLSPEQIAFTLNHSQRLVQQYLDLDKELQPNQKSNHG